MVALYRKFQKRFCASDPNVLLVVEIHYIQIQKAAYIYKKSRKEDTPPIILIRKTAEIEERDILDEMAHVKEENEGWIEQKEKAHKLFLEDLEDSLMALNGEKIIGLPLEIRGMVNDFFSDEMACKYGFGNIVLEKQKGELNKWIELYSSVTTRPESYRLYMIIAAAFRIALPPSYPQKDDKNELEKIVIDHIRQMGMEPFYQKIKSVVSQLESPPKLNNIYKCETEIIELAQDFLEKQ